MKNNVMSNSIAKPERFTRFPNEIPIDLLEYADIYRNENIFNDVSIIVENECIPANKMVLSCFSDFFKEKFLCGAKEKYKNKIIFESLDGKAVKNLIDYMYTGSIDIDDENVMKLLAAADYLQLDDVQTYCFEYLSSNITTDNWLDILKTAIKYKRDRAKRHTYRYITIQFSEIARTDNFKALSKDNLKDLLSHLIRCLMLESSIYEGIMNWIKHKGDVRKNDCLDLFQMIQFDRLPHDFIQNILEEDLIKANDAYNHYFLTALSQVPESQAEIAQDSKLISVNASFERIIEVHNLPSFDGFPKQDFGYSLLKKRNYIFWIGGCAVGDYDYDNYNHMVVALPSIKDKSLMWRGNAPMKEERFNMGATVHEGLIVVAGGQKECDDLASVEVYNFPLDKWKTISSMNKRRSGHSLVSCQGSLYALGGILGSDSSVERLRDLRGTWEESPPMLKPRSFFAAVNCENVIYAIGGNCGLPKETKTKSVEKFIPETNRWEYASEMHTERSGHAACVMQDKVYVAGGKDVNEKTVKTIECYNPLTDSWSIVGETNIELASPSIFAS